MKITGQIIEVGQLDGEGGEHGVVVETEDWQQISVKGLTPAQTGEFSPQLFSTVTLSIEPPFGMTPENMAAMVQDAKGGAT